MALIKIKNQNVFIDEIHGINVLVDSLCVVGDELGKNGYIVGSNQNFGGLTNQIIHNLSVLIETV